MQPSKPSVVMLTHVFIYPAINQVVVLEERIPTTKKGPPSISGGGGGVKISGVKEISVLAGREPPR